MEHFSNREEPNALEMTNVIKSVTSFLNPHNDRCYQLELIPTCFLLQTPKEGTFTGRHKIKGHNFLPSFPLHDQGERKLKPAV